MKLAPHLYIFLSTAALLTGMTASEAHSQQIQPQGIGSSSGQSQGPGRGSGRDMGMRGMGAMGGARGVLGTVTEVTADHYTIKTDVGDIYTVHFSVNTRILKQPAGAGSGTASGQTRHRSQADTESGDFSERAQPQSIKPSEVKVGDMITAGGEMDQATKSIGAIFIMQLDPEHAKQARAMQANYGKTWLAGRITTIDGTKITIDGMIDHTPHAIEVDENTSFRKRRDSVTLADIHPGDQLRAEGAVKDGGFLATAVNAVDAAEFQNREARQGPTAGSSQPH